MMCDGWRLDEAWKPSKARTRLPMLAKLVLVVLCRCAGEKCGVFDEFQGGDNAWSDV